jgi:hypothetical protein
VCACVCTCVCVCVCCVLCVEHGVVIVYFSVLADVSLFG